MYIEYMCLFRSLFMHSSISFLQIILLIFKKYLYTQTSEICFCKIMHNEEKEFSSNPRLKRETISSIYVGVTLFNYYYYNGLHFLTNYIFFQQFISTYKCVLHLLLLFEQCVRKMIIFSGMQTKFCK